MKKLWIKCSKVECNREAQRYIFLFFNVLFWMLAGFLVSLLVNLIGQISIEKAIENMVIFTGYAGVVIGWFGGVLFLMRQD